MLSNWQCCAGLVIIMIVIQYWYSDQWHSIGNKSLYCVNGINNYHTEIKV